MPIKAEIEITGGSGSGPIDREPRTQKQQATRNKRARRKRRIRVRRKHFKQSQEQNRQERENRRRKRAEEQARERERRERRRAAVHSRQASRDFINDFFGSFGHSRFGYRINRGIDLVRGVTSDESTGNKVVDVLKDILNALLGKSPKQQQQVKDDVEKHRPEFTYRETETFKSTHRPDRPPKKPRPSQPYRQEDVSGDEVGKIEYKSFKTNFQDLGYTQPRDPKTGKFIPRPRGIIPHPTVASVGGRSGAPGAGIIEAPWWKGPDGVTRHGGSSRMPPPPPPPPRLPGPPAGATPPPPPIPPNVALGTAAALLGLTASVIAAEASFKSLKSDLEEMPGDLMFASIRNELQQFQQDLRRAGEFGRELAEIELIKGETSRTMQRALDNIRQELLPISKGFNKLLEGLATLLEPVMALMGELIGPIADAVGGILGILGDILSFIGDLASGKFWSRLFDDANREPPDPANALKEIYTLLGFTDIDLGGPLTKNMGQPHFLPPDPNKGPGSISPATYKMWQKVAPAGWK